MAAKKPVELTTVQALELCQTTLGSVPITISQQASIGQPIAEVIGILEQIKQALVRVENEQKKKEGKNDA